MSNALPRAVEKVIEKVMSSRSPSANINPAPVLKRSSTAQALKRCRAAWQRAYKATYAEYMEEDDENEYRANDKAIDAAAEAYCNVMPILSDRESIRDFVACVAHGLLIGAVPEDKSSHLLYAAQVANCTIQRVPKPTQKKRSK